MPRDMDFSILLSSLAGIYGSAVQANYAAGNTFQDSLARMRTAAGFKRSVALDLGWMVDIGMLTETENEPLRRHRDNTQDMAPVRSTDLFVLLDHFCDPALPHLATLNDSQLLLGTVTPADFRARGAQPLPWLSQPLFAGFDVVLPDAADSVRKTSGAMKEDHARMFRQAEKPERLSIVAEAMKYKMARTISVEPSDIDPEKSLAAYGIDSLMAVELRNWLGKDFRANLTVFEIMGATNVDVVAELVVERAHVGK